MLLAASALALSTTLLLVLYRWDLHRRSRSSHFPPGPPKDPIIGHIRYLPAGQCAHVFHEWAKTYGDVMHLDVFGESMIILDSYQAAVDLLEKRGAIYSDRPSFPLYELLRFTNLLPLMKYGKKFARHRQIHQTYLSRQNCVKFQPIQTRRARQLVRELLTRPPENYIFLLNKFSIGIIINLVSGQELTADNDFYLQLSKMVNTVFLRTGIRLYDYPLERVQQQKEDGNTVPSFLLSHLEATNENASSLDVEELKGAASTLFITGESTTWSALSVFVLAMVLHPECQSKAREELDSIIGTFRLPSFEDRQRLPYIECILQETLRWSPVAQLSIPHRCTKDDFYRDMLIPEGVLLFPNVKGMSLDERIYTNPAAFIPERYLPQPLGSGEPYFEAIWGFGRRSRACTGRHLADNSLWIAIATILATCTISNAVDEHGGRIIPDCVMSDGIASHPNDFKCIITSRRPLA